MPSRTTHPPPGAGLIARAESFLTFQRLLTVLFAMAAGGLSLTLGAARSYDGVRSEMAAHSRRLDRLEHRDSVLAAHVLFQSCVTAATMDSISPRACASLRPR